MKEKCVWVKGKNVGFAAIAREVQQMSDVTRLGSCCRGPVIIKRQHNKLSADMLKDADYGCR